jgi:uncharacterized membrane protein YhaH (DUF805 family)
VLAWPTDCRRLALREAPPASQRRRRSVSLSYVWLSLEGRINREVYWLKFAVPYIVAYLVAILIDAAAIAVDIYAFPILFLIVALAGIWPGIAAAVKRLHDRGRSGWFLLLALIPFVNIWIMIEVYFLKGTEGANPFGADPLAAAAAA